MILEIHYLWRNIIKLSGLRRNIWVRMIPKYLEKEKNLFCWMAACLTQPVVTALRQSKPGVFWAFPDDISTREGGGGASLSILTPSSLAVVRLRPAGANVRDRRLRTVTAGACDGGRQGAAQALPSSPVPV